MRKLDKVVPIVSVLAVLSLYCCANAETFERTPELVQKIAISVGKSGVVQGRPTRIKNKKKSRRVAGKEVCENRLRLLREIVESGCITDSNVNGVVGMYLRNAHLNPNTPEGQCLRKSGSAGDLLHNVHVLMEIYEDLAKSI